MDNNKNKQPRESVIFLPLSKQNWNDFETLFGRHGAYGGCWCMWWRISRKEFEKQQGEGNRLAMKALVDRGECPGILAYIDQMPVGWCSVAPRKQFQSLNRSPVLKRIDQEDVWSIVCFYIAKPYRGRGMTKQLIHAAVAHVRNNAGKLVEAYPTDPRGRTSLAPMSVFMGLPGIFQGAGFKICARPSKAKVIMRYQF
jgi:GNAT superfamily N-acetyltransferase